jgi:hypothetical protein
MARVDDRTTQIIEGKCKVGNTKKLRMALAGNNPGVVKQVNQMNRRGQRMLKHARLVTALLIRAAGGDAPTVLAVEVKPIDLYHARIAHSGTTISTKREIVPNKPKKGKSHKAIRSLHQRIVNNAIGNKRVRDANAEVMAKLLSGEIGRKPETV